LIDNLLLEKMERSSLKRYGSPEEVAELLLFLASDESTYITGQTFAFDGGIG
jgi:NAD(P)-dependent dehydrogenase (short-subunit alcohol dehydrogenase family)